MSVQFHIVYQRDKHWDRNKVPLGYIRLNIPNAWNKNNGYPDHSQLLWGLKRNDYIKIMPGHPGGKSIIRRVMNSGKLQQDEIVIDYDSTLHLNGGNTRETRTVVIRKIRRLRVLGPMLFYLYSTPDMGMRLSSWLGLIGVVLGMMGVAISILD